VRELVYFELSVSAFCSRNATLSRGSVTNNNYNWKWRR